ncbi:response regulator [Thiofilum flexile]|uniref:response regulator n=1 Tax=Thiofilum flexile TaxID=125627 RepID=UPI0003721A23|nr:response regulator [Thiofilum flexile]
MRILLVEDDGLIGEAVGQALKDEAYALDWVRDGEQALGAIQIQEYGLILLDLGLPRRDGFAVLQHLRQTKQLVPVIIITARDSVEERIKGLDFGADDYLVKPFAINELLARMRAIIRRHQGNANPVLSNGVICLDPATREAQREAEERIQLSAREYALLHALMLRPGSILSRSELEERIYGWNEEVESNVVEFLIHSLRRKLGKDAIKNIRGLGWMVSKAV